MSAATGAQDAGVRRFARSFRDTIRESKRANDLYADLAGKPRLDYSAYNLDKPKRAPSVPKTNTPSEHQSQVAVISWWHLAYKGYGLPEFALFAIPNGGARDVITGSRLKAEGVRPGIPDLMLAAKRNIYCGLVIEMKKPHNQPNAAQKEVLAYFNSAGYARAVCWTSDAAIATIKSYLC